jgi:pyruvate dehydrogenase E1 component beta subunit
MVTSRLFRPASRFLSPSQPFSALSKSAYKPSASLPATVSRRRYATPSGSKEMAVRDALNEALAEELESNDKVFVLGEEVAQYNGA